MIRVLPDWVKKFEDKLRFFILDEAVNKENINLTFINDSVAIKNAIETISMTLLRIQDEASPQVDKRNFDLYGEPTDEEISLEGLYDDTTDNNTLTGNDARRFVEKMKEKENSPISPEDKKIAEEIKKNAKHFEVTHYTKDQRCAKEISGLIINNNFKDFSILDIENNQNIRRNYTDTDIKRALRNLLDLEFISIDGMGRRRRYIVNINKIEEIKKNAT